MKNKIKILGGIILTAIYCLTASGFAIDLPINHDLKDNRTSEQDRSFSSASTVLFCHIPQQESLINSPESFPTLSFKDSFNSLFGLAKRSEQLFKLEITRYVNFSTHFLIQYGKTDIIFPFHYFW